MINVARMLPLHRERFLHNALLALASVCMIFFPGVRTLAGQQTSGDMPMQPVSQDGAEFRWLQKKILDSRLFGQHG